jgi:hypothetical protein
MADAPAKPRRAQVADLVGMEGTRRTLFVDRAALVMDNSRLSEDQLAVLDNLLGLVPPALHDTRAIGVVDLIGPFPPELTWWGFFGGKGGEINIFSTAPGAVRGNPFPPDVAPATDELFTAALAHEVNHIVGAFAVERNAKLRARRNRLVAAAGCEPERYLRSMLPACFFVQAPQEFFASIANQWFTDTARTLELALVRFDRGIRHPLDQFLFFAQVYSGKGKETWFYEMLLPHGGVERTAVPVTKNRAGQITSLTFDGTTYHFTLDRSGNVTSYTR